jgi:hypothetical protein
MNGMNNQSFLITQEADIIDKESKLKIWFDLEASVSFRGCLTEQNLSEMS